MEKEKNEQVVFVKDLLFAALYRWRQILAMGLIFAVLLGVVGGLLEWKSVSASISQEELAAATEKYESKRLQLEKKVENYQNLVDSQENYNVEAPLMLLDPYRVYRASIELTVWPSADQNAQNNVDIAGAVLNAYAAYLKSERVINQAAEAIGMQSKYLSELVQLVNGGVETRSLTVTVSSAAAEDTQNVLNILVAGVENAGAQIEQNVGKYNVTVVVSGVDERVNPLLIDQQKLAQTRLKDLRTQLSDAQKELDDLQAPAAAAGISKKKIVIFAVLGAILGVMLVVGIACFRHVAGGVVYSGRTLKNCTGVKLLGCMMLKRPKSKVDRWLRKLEGRCLTDETAVVAVTVKNYCGKDQKLLLAGSCEQANQKVAQLLNKAAISVEACGSLLSSAQTLEALPQCDAVLLVERCGSSKYQDVLLALERIEDQNKPVIGCVLLDG